MTSPAIIHRSCPAKVNLTLSIVGKRSDGFHDIVSLFQPISLCDELTVTITEGSGITITCNDPGVPTDERNLIYTAARSFLDHAGLKCAVALKLIKRIPVGAGLGGGSSDAAGALMALNEATDELLSEEELFDLALGIGSDVPFFLLENAAIAMGRGERLKPIELPKYKYLLVNPGFEVSAAWAYNRLHLTKKDEDNILNDLVEGIKGPRSVVDLLSNDLEVAVLEDKPVIERLKQDLLREGALGALMSGSGPTVFGIFGDDDTLVKAFKDLTEKVDEKTRVIMAEGL